ncbi:MAG: cupin domain-containing protein [Candidatus Bathyarchaeia archaeon]|jgi:quercetin dioxygenase-like cupin family protein
MQHNRKNVSKAGLMAPTRMADLITYQKGSVVSRAIVDRKSGTVTLFAFDKEEGLSEHKPPFDALIYVVDGEAQVTVAGKSFALKEGEMVVMPANKPHALRATRRFKMLLVMIRA